MTITLVLIYSCVSRLQLTINFTFPVIFSGSVLYLLKLLSCYYSLRVALFCILRYLVFTSQTFFILKNVNIIFFPVLLKRCGHFFPRSDYCFGTEFIFLLDLFLITLLLLFSNENSMHTPLRILVSICIFSDFLQYSFRCNNTYTKRNKMLLIGKLLSSKRFMMTRKQT